MADNYTRLDYAERWMRDGFSVVPPPGFFVSLEVDMSNVARLLARLKERGERVTYTHIFVRAVALVLDRHPDLHHLLSHRWRLSPCSVDIGLSVAGSMFAAPVLVIRDAARKSLAEIREETIRGAPAVRASQQRFLRMLRRWGWLVPFGVLRRAFLRFITRQLWFRRKGVGTFQISCAPQVDQIVPFLFQTTAILGIGRVCQRLGISQHGEPQVRPTVFLSCCADHRVWDGNTAATFLNELQKTLVSEDLEVLLQRA